MNLLCSKCGRIMSGTAAYDGACVCGKVITKGEACMNLEIPQSVIDYMARPDPLKGWPERVERYRQRVFREYQALRPLLPNNLSTIVDIGSGLAGVPALLARRDLCAEVHLIDGDGSLPRNGGYEAGMKAWSDVSFGKTMVEANSFAKVSAYTPDRMPPKIACNVLMSFKSWGHHYPVETYLPFAQASLSKGAFLVIDIRLNSGGVETLRANGFRHMVIWSETPKCIRTVWLRT